MVSAAQVANHYGAYTFKAAMDLGRAEREFLLAVALADDERKMDRWERVLGLTWDVDSLVAISAPGGKNQAADSLTKVPAKISIPALLAMAPEVLKEISTTYRRKLATAHQPGDVPQGNTVVEVSNLSAADAKAFFKRMASGAAQAPSPPDETE